MSTLAQLNTLPLSDLEPLLKQCCASIAWVVRMTEHFPIDSNENLLKLAFDEWVNLSEADKLEAYAAHPKIGDAASLRKKYDQHSNWSKQEQQHVAEAKDEVLHELVLRNNEYFERFGFIFIVFATGKSAEQMLEIIKSRLPNTREQELENASLEQAKITHLRLEKLLTT